jgi:hypothetical protein
MSVYVGCVNECGRVLLTAGNLATNGRATREAIWTKFRMCLALGPF